MYSHVLFIVYESSPHTCISCTCMRSIYLIFVPSLIGRTGDSIIHSTIFGHMLFVSFRALVSFLVHLVQ